MWTLRERGRGLSVSLVRAETMSSVHHVSSILHSPWHIVFVGWMKQNCHVFAQSWCSTHQAYKVIFRKQMLAQRTHSSQLLSFLLFLNKRVLTDYYSAEVIVVTTVVKMEVITWGSRLTSTQSISPHASEAAFIQVKLTSRNNELFHWFGVLFYTLFILLLSMCFLHKMWYSQLLSSCDNIHKSKRF